MSKEALTRVRNAETEAAAIRDKANADAQVMLEANEKACAAEAEQQLTDTAAEWKEKLQAVQEKAARLIDLSRESAGDEAQQIREQAEGKMPEAVKVIMREMYRSCQ